jgi:hypothetical protein
MSKLIGDFDIIESYFDVLNGFAVVLDGFNFSLVLMKQRNAVDQC